MHLTLAPEWGRDTKTSNALQDQNDQATEAQSKQLLGLGFVFLRTMEKSELHLNMIRFLLLLFCVSLSVTKAQAPAMQWLDEFVCLDVPSENTFWGGRLIQMTNGDVITVNSLVGHVDLDPGSGEVIYPALPYPHRRATISRYDPEGALLWSFALGDADGSASALFGCELQGGDFLILGSTNDALDLDPGLGTVLVNAIGNEQCIWLARYTANGALVWGRDYPNTSGCYPHAFKADATDALYISGGFNSRRVSRRGPCVRWSTGAGSRSGDPAGGSSRYGPSPFMGDRSFPERGPELATVLAAGNFPWLLIHHAHEPFKSMSNSFTGKEINTHPKVNNAYITARLRFLLNK